jgi:hypothetical protein
MAITKHKYAALYCKKKGPLTEIYITSQTITIKTKGYTYMIEVSLPNKDLQHEY